MICGVTQNCYSSFGIISSLVYGNSSNTNEFTIEAIIPELLNIDTTEELRGPSGIVVTLDTTQLQHNFLLGQGESGRESVNNYGDEATESM